MSGHGTLRRYSHGGCRCELCVSNRSEYDKNRRPATITPGKTTVPWLSREGITFDQLLEWAWAIHDRREGKANQP